MPDLTYEIAGTKDKTVFMAICPRNNEYIDNVVEGFKLRVVQKDGVVIKPDVRFNTTDLNSGKKHFQNNSTDKQSFTITVMLHVDDTFHGKPFTKVDGNYFVDDETPRDISVIDALDYFIRQGEPFYVYTRAVGIKNDEMYIITKNDSRKQYFDDGWVKWDLTFTRYNLLIYGTFKAKSAGVDKAKKAYENKKKKQAEAKKKKTAKYKLKHNCKYTQLKYSKKKKVVQCVKYMQTILYNKKYLKGNKKTVIDGWYGKTTKQAVKAFQKDYFKTHNVTTSYVNQLDSKGNVVGKMKMTKHLKATGKVDKATFNGLCS